VGGVLLYAKKGATSEATEIITVNFIEKEEVYAHTGRT
jgi:hypothetical protein